MWLRTVCCNSNVVCDAMYEEGHVMSFLFFYLNYCLLLLLLFIIIVIIVYCSTPNMAAVFSPDTYIKFPILHVEPEECISFGRPRHRWEDNVKMDIQKKRLGAWSGLVWLRRGSSGGLLWTWEWTFGFYKMRTVGWIAEELQFSQEGVCSFELEYTVSRSRRHHS